MYNPARTKLAAWKSIEREHGLTDNLANVDLFVQLALSTIAVDKFVDKLLTRRISHLSVRIFSFLANFCTMKKTLIFQGNM